jgi:hypothetical protein
VISSFPSELSIIILFAYASRTKLRLARKHSALAMKMFLVFSLFVIARG